jgi:hypothetical protein
MPPARTNQLLIYIMQGMSHNDQASREGLRLGIALVVKGNWQEDIRGSVTDRLCRVITSSYHNFHKNKLVYP